MTRVRIFLTLSAFSWSIFYTVSPGRPRSYCLIDLIWCCLPSSDWNWPKSINPDLWLLSLPNSMLSIGWYLHWWPQFSQFCYENTPQRSNHLDGVVFLAVSVKPYLGVRITVQHNWMNMFHALWFPRMIILWLSFYNHFHAVNNMWFKYWIKILSS